MSEDKRKDAASDKGASKDDAGASGSTSKNTAQAATSAASADSGSGQASAPATDTKPAKASADKGAGPAGSSGRSSGKTKAKPKPSAGSTGKSSDKSKPSTPSPTPRASASGADPAPARGQSDTAAASSRPVATAASGSGSAGGGTPYRGTPSGGSNNGGSAKIVAVIAIVVALVAIALSGWVVYRGQGKLQSVDARLATVEKGMQSNVQDVVMPRVKRLDSNVQALGDDLEDQSQTLSSLADKLASTQQSLQQTQTRASQMEDQLSGNKNRWDLNQIEALLQAANERLQLYDDPQGARQALTLANEAIRRKGDPRLFELRGEIVNEIAALEALPDPDVEGMSLALAAMIERVPDLPLASSVPGEYSQDDGSAQADDGNGESDAGLSVAQMQAEFSKGWTHFKGSVGDALSGMLTIRRADGTQRALLPPDQAFFLSQNLQLQLRTARLALLARDTQNYRDSLATAGQWLSDYYDTSAAPVASMQERIGQMSNGKLDWDAPDISASLGMLREMKSQRSATDSNAGKANDNAGDAAGQDGQ